MIIISFFLFIFTGVQYTYTQPLLKPGFIIFRADFVHKQVQELQRPYSAKERITTGLRVSYQGSTKPFDSTKPNSSRAVVGSHHQLQEDKRGVRSSAASSHGCLLIILVSRGELPPATRPTR
jgi:hypothetical protein